MTEFKKPKDTKDVGGFLDLTGYYWHFVPVYASKAEPLFCLTRKVTLFCLTSAAILCFPNFTQPFYVYTDTCNLGLGAALMQKDDFGRDVVVAFASRTLHKAEKPYSTPENEYLGVIWELRQEMLECFLC